jgi:hypothetical protein
VRVSSTPTPPGVSVIDRRELRQLTHVNDAFLRSVTLVAPKTSATSRTDMTIVVLTNLYDDNPRGLSTASPDY